MKNTAVTYQEIMSSLPNEMSQISEKLYFLLSKYVTQNPEINSDNNGVNFKCNEFELKASLTKDKLIIKVNQETLSFVKAKYNDINTTKDSIIFQIKEDLPWALVEVIIDYNCKNKKENKITIWNKYNDNWENYSLEMSQLLNTLPLQKTIKWGAPVYTYKNKNIVGWAGFKNFFSVWFYQGIFIDDNLNVLVNAQENKTKYLRQWRFKALEKLDIEGIKNYINQSIKAVESNKKLEIKSNPDFNPQEFLNLYFNENNTVISAFLKLTPGKQKEYIKYIDEAKLEKTKQSRLAKITPLILAGKGLNDIYKK